MVSIIIFVALLAPLIVGALSDMSENRIRKSLWSIFDNIEVLISMFFSIFFTRKIFFENDKGIYKNIYDLIPRAFKLFITSNSLITYMISVPLLLLIILLFVRFFTAPIISSFINPFSNTIFKTLRKKNYVVQRLIGAVWQIPKSIFYILVFSLLINLTNYIYSNEKLIEWMDTSNIYQYINKVALQPVINSDITKKIPVLFKNTFKPPDIQQITELARGNVRVIEYFNGVTLDEAIKSSPEIDGTAKAIVGNEINSRKKANLIYSWISKNIKYDYEKAQAVSIDSRGVSSGSIVAFDTRKGICFDYSSLYISMCRAVGLKVRLITGLGYSGESWGDHAWNQVYCDESASWINVDTTFGTVANYFDKADFGVDHKYDEIQGEW